LRALSAALRLDSHILAFLARFFLVIPDRRERVPKDLQRNCAQDGFIAGYCWVVQYPIARLPNNRVDF
jgi:hypothetical protein